MTTELAARSYLAEHLLSLEGKGYVVYNPLNKPIIELPVIYGFNNGGSRNWLSAVAIAEDGTELGGHVCSDEGYMPHDLGVIEGTRLDRHEKDYRPHYPNGYRMEFVRYVDIEKSRGLQAALLANKNKETK